MPADLLAAGCSAARRKVDHPAKILPAIFAEVEGIWNARKRDLRNVERLSEIAGQPMPSPDPEGSSQVTPEAVAEILARHNLTPTGAKREQRHVGPPRMPTDAELAEIMREMGLAAGPAQSGAK